VGRAHRAAHTADRGIETTTLELPEGYTLKPMDPSEESSRMLVLKRSDGSSVVRFEFSALGPGPLRSYELAAEGSLIHDHHPRSKSFKMQSGKFRLSRSHQALAATPHKTTPC
jgi:hypothetical protein